MRLVSGSVDTTLQLPLRECILRLLDDKNSDVSTMAIKCLSQLSTRLSQEHLTFIVDKLADIIVDPTKTSARDIVTDGLQTLIASIQDDAGASIAPKLILSLLRGLTQKPTAEIDCEMACLTIVKNVSEQQTYRQACKARFGSSRCCSLLLAHLLCLLCPRLSSCSFASATMSVIITLR